MPEEAELTQLWRLVDGWRRQQRFPPSQSALAKDIGVARGAVTQWKYGETRPTPDHMRRLQSATGLRYRDLLDAMLIDMGYLPKERDGNEAAPIARTPRGKIAKGETARAARAPRLPQTDGRASDQP